jgi:hypothetical protein
VNAPGHSTAATKGLVKKPRPMGTLFTVDALAEMFKRSPKSIYHLAQRLADEMGPPMYCQLYWPKDRKLYRVFPPKDVRALCWRFPVYVKEINTVSKKIARR